MQQKVLVKKLSQKQIFELLFREPTKEEKEMLELMKIEEEKRKLKIWNKTNEKFNKKKIICKLKAIDYIEENLGNYSIRYYKYSGHALMYKDSKLMGILSTNIEIPSDIEIKPWLSYSINDKMYISYDVDKYKSFYDNIHDQICVKRNIKGSNRVNFNIIRKEA